MKKTPFLVVGLVALVLGACAPARFVEPLDKGELTVGGSLGGPVISFGGPIPMPLSSVEVGYGLDSNLTVFGAIHTTAAYFGNLQLDAGISYKFLNQRKFVPNLSASPSFNLVYNFESKAVKFWPILDVNAYWNYGDRQNYFYVGFNNYFELSSTMANDQPQTQHWIFNPQLGHILKGKGGKFQFTAEIKFLAPYADNSTAFIPYQSLTGSRGATGFYLGGRWIIGKNN